METFVDLAFLDHLATAPLRDVAPAAWYEAFSPGTPDLLVLRLPEQLYAARAGVPSLRRTLKVLFAETPGDREYLEKCLARPLPFVAGALSFRMSVDATNARRSTFPEMLRMGVLHYAPPAELAGWPHVAVLMSGLHIQDPLMMRGRYAWNAAPDEEGAVKQLSDYAYQAGMSGMSMQVKSPRDTANA